MLREPCRKVAPFLPGQWPEITFEFLKSPLRNSRLPAFKRSSFNLGRSRRRIVLATVNAALFKQGKSPARRRFTQANAGSI